MKILVSSILFILMSALSFSVLAADNDMLFNKYWNEAVSLAKSNKVLEGEALLSAVILKNKNVPKLYLLRGKYRQKYSKNISGAISDYNILEKSTSSTPVETYWYRGMCYYEIKLYAQAVNDYSKAIRVNPAWGKMYLYRAKAYAKMNKVNESLRDLKMLVKYDPKYKKKAQDLYQKMIQGRSDF